MSSFAFLWPGEANRSGLVALSWLLLLSWLLPLPTTAQATDPVPGLRRALAQATTDSTRGRLYLELSNEAESEDSTAYFARQAVAHLRAALATARGPERQLVLQMLGGATFHIGAYGYSFTDFKQAQTLYRQAARLSWRAGDIETYVMIQQALGASQIDAQGDYAGALRTLRDAVRVGEHTPAALGNVAKCLGSIADVYVQLSDTVTAIRYKEQAVAMSERFGDTDMLAVALLQLTDCYLLWRREPTRAERYVERLQQLIAREPESKEWLVGYVAWGLGRIRFIQRRWTDARPWLEQALTEFTRKGELDNQLHALLQLAKVEEQLRDLPRALRYANQAQALVGASGTPPARRNVERLLARLYEQLHQPQRALDHYRRYIGLRDSLESETSKKAAYQERLRGEYAAKEAALRARQTQREAVAAAETRRQRQLRIVLLVAAGLLLALAGVLWNRNRLKQRANKLLESQKLDLAVAAGKLEALNRTKDRLFAIVAHDLRNPLTALTGLQSIIQHHVRRGQPERIATLGDHLHQTAHALHGVLDNVLGWAVSQRGELTPHPEPVDVPRLVSEAVSIGQLQATAQEIDLRVQVAPGAALVTDRQMLHVLVRNLLGNALKFTPAGGTVTLTVEPAAEGLRFGFRDTGPGFSEAAAVAWATAEVGPRTPDASGRQGVGLGLVVCRAFTHQLGGTLTWQNLPTGGAEVQLWLPANLSASTPAPGASAPARRVLAG